MKTDLVFALFIALSNSACGAELIVEGLRSAEGHVAISVFAENAGDAFPDKGDKAIKTFYLKIERPGLFRMTLIDIPPGRYGLALMHDEDSDGKFKSGPFGIPREGYGFSNDPGVYFGPPAFEKVLVPVEEDTSIKVKMKYML